MSLRISHLWRRLLIQAACLIAMLALAMILGAGLAQPALAQEDVGKEPGPLLKGRAIAEGLWEGLNGPDFTEDEGEGQNGGEGSGDGSGEGSGNGGSGSEGGSSDSSGGGWDSSGSGGMSEEASQGRFGPWTGLINLLLGLLSAAGGIGIASGIGLLATAGGRESQIEVGKKVLEGSFGGFLIGTMSIPIYEVITRVVVGF